MSDGSPTAADRQPERLQLPRYHSDEAQVVIYNPKKPLAWISADPRDVVELEDDG